MSYRTQNRDAINLGAAARDMAGVLAFLGFTPDEGLADTPKRVVKALAEMTAGYGLSANQVLGTQFDSEGYNEWVILRDIEFSSLCEHHLLPFTGVAHVGYVPKSKIVGLSKLARLVEMHARRLQNQERLTRSIGEDLAHIMMVDSVAVRVSAHHQCMGCRGAHQPRATMITAYETGPAERLSQFGRLLRAK